MKKILALLAILAGSGFAAAAQSTLIHPVNVYIVTGGGEYNRARPGEEIRIMAALEIRRESQKIVASANFRPAIGPPMPVLVLGVKPPGIHNETLAIFKVPVRIPRELLVDITINGKLMIGNLKFKFVDEGTGKKYLALDEEATVLRYDIYPAPEPVAGIGKPDLVISLGHTFRITHDGVREQEKVFTLENMGNAGANHVNIRFECYVNGIWVPGNIQPERIIFLPAGASQLIKNTKKFYCTSAATKWRLAADPDNEIRELDENNNNCELDL